MMFQISDLVVQSLKHIVGERNVFLDYDSLVLFGQDAINLYRPSPCAVVMPETTAQVQQLVLLANEQQLALVPSGGRTGLSGAATACNGELVVAMDRMNKIMGFDKANQSVCCQAGVITRQLQNYAEEQGLYYPVDFASSGSSQIGGNIATNAGGIKVIRYGMTRNWVLGLTVVTGRGEVLELNQGLMKNNAGYDLRQIFIGAEGTLGFVTEATIKLTRVPADLCVLVLGLNDFTDIVQVLLAFRSKMDITAFEFFSEQALEKVTRRHGLQRPFETVTPFYVLIEFENRIEEDMASALALFEVCLDEGWVLDGTISQSRQQAKNLWRLREDISETLSRWSPYKNDLSVTVSQVPKFLEEVGAVVKTFYPDFEIIWYGHIGDGNVHLNILKPDSLDIDVFKSACAIVSERIFEIVKAYHGSVSAEHGIGLLKKPYLSYTRSESEIAIMQKIKQVFDPRGIMNPGKIFD